MSEINWNKIVKGFEAYGVGRARHFEFLELTAGRIYLKLALKRVNEKGKLFDSDLIMESDKYRAKGNSIGQIEIYRSRERKPKFPYVVFENLINVQGIPTLVEARIASFPSGKLLKREEKTMESYFWRDYGHIILATEECMNPTNPALRKFREHGGIAEKLIINRNEFRRELRNVLEKHGIFYKDGQEKVLAEK